MFKQFPDQSTHEFVQTMIGETESSLSMAIVRLGLTWSPSPESACLFDAVFGKLWTQRHFFSLHLSEDVTATVNSAGGVGYWEGVCRDFLCHGFACSFQDTDQA